MGVTVRQKRKGKGNPWWIFIHEDGKITSRQIGDRHAAEAVASEMRQQLAAGKLNLTPNEAPEMPEFVSYARLYLESYAKTTLKRNTWEGYTVIIEKHLVPVWQGKRLDEIRRADVKQLLLQKLQEGFRPGTVENIKALVSGIFTHAYEDEILTANPALKLGKFIPKQDVRAHVGFLTREETQQFLATARTLAPEHYALFLCAFRTGMRLGELLGLAWEDIDFDGNVIEVRRAYSHGTFTTPKSHKSRTISVSNQLKLSLQNHRVELKQRFCGDLPVCEVPDRLKGGKHVHLVFPSKSGGATDGDNLRQRVFKNLLKEAGVRKIRIHDIRHTFATMLLQQGEPVNSVKDLMGHASIQTTVDVYGHLMPGATQKAVNKLDDVLDSSAPLALATAG